MDWRQPMEKLAIGKGECLKHGNDVAVITIGTTAYNTAKAIEKVEAITGKNFAHYDIRFLKPLDNELLHEIGRKFDKVVTVEEGVLNGGFGSAVLEFMADNQYKGLVKRIGIQDEFVEHGTPEELHQLIGLDTESIAANLIAFTEK